VVNSSITTRDGTTIAFDVLGAPLLVPIFSDQFADRIDRRMGT
jgi:hypothetical protein